MSSFGGETPVSVATSIAGTGSYTVPSGKYAKVTILLRPGPSDNITVAGEQIGNGNIFSAQFYLQSGEAVVATTVTNDFFMSAVEFNNPS